MIDLGEGWFWSENIAWSALSGVFGVLSFSCGEGSGDFGSSYFGASFGVSFSSDGFGTIAIKLSRSNLLKTFLIKSTSLSTLGLIWYILLWIALTDRYVNWPYSPILSFFRIVLDFLRSFSLYTRNSWIFFHLWSPKSVMASLRLFNSLWVQRPTLFWAFFGSVKVDPPRLWLFWSESSAEFVELELALLVFESDALYSSKASSEILLWSRKYFLL